MHEASLLRCCTAPTVQPLTFRWLPTCLHSVARAVPRALHVRSLFFWLRSRGESGPQPFGWRSLAAEVVSYAERRLHGTLRKRNGKGCMRRSGAQCFVVLLHNKSTDSTNVPVGTARKPLRYAGVTPASPCASAHGRRIGSLALRYRVTRGKAATSATLLQSTWAPPRRQLIPMQHTYKLRHLWCRAVFGSARQQPEQSPSPSCLRALRTAHHNERLTYLT